MKAASHQSESSRFIDAMRHLITVKPSDLASKSETRKHPAKAKPKKKG
jgi:hypothetical protein